MQNAFLTAAWKNLIMANYEIDAAVLLPYLPAHTQLDYFKNRCLVSLVGFRFEKIKIKGVSFPYHTQFPEVNLRFYVKHKHGEQWRRGVVFISEIVPKPAVVWIANTLFKEKYIAAPMKQALLQTNENISIEYNWKCKGEWNAIAVKAQANNNPIQKESEEEFIFEHYFGYAKVNEKITNEYAVEHPSWNVYPVCKHAIFCNFEKVYGKSFSCLNNIAPNSVLLAQGSPVIIGNKRKIQ